MVAFRFEVAVIYFSLGERVTTLATCRIIA
jgi:hypothetical protein